MTHQLFLSIFPIYITDLGGSHTLTGAMITGQVIAGAVTRLVCGPLQDRFGCRKLLIAGAFLFAFNIITYMFTTNLTVIFVLRVFNGVSQGIYFGSAGTIVADIAAPDRLVDGVGFFSISGTLAAAFSPAMGLYLLQNHGSRAMFGFAASAAFISTVFPLLINKKYGSVDKCKPQVASKGSPNKPGNSLTATSFIELSILAPAAVSFFIVFANSSATNFLASLGVERALDGIGLFFTFNSVAMIIIRLIAGKLNRKFGASTMILSGCICLIVANLLIVIAHSTLPLVIAGILTGLGMGVVSPLLNSIVFQIARPERRGVANSNFLLVNDIGQGLGGSLWGTISQYKGYAATYFLSAVCVFIAGLTHKLFLFPKIKKQGIQGNE